MILIVSKLESSAASTIPVARHFTMSAAKDVKFKLTLHPDIT